MGTRENAADKDFSGIPLEEEVEEELKDTAVISMGTEISPVDLLNITSLCDQVCTPMVLWTHPLPHSVSIAQSPPALELYLDMNASGAD